MNPCGCEFLPDQASVCKQCIQNVVVVALRDFAISIFDFIDFRDKLVIFRYKVVLNQVFVYIELAVAPVV